MVGIDPECKLFVGVGPLMHESTRFFISIEFKASQAEAALKNGWHFWEREKQSNEDAPVEVMVAGTHDRFLDFTRFEQAALGLSQGHRLLLAENLDRYQGRSTFDLPGKNMPSITEPEQSEVHSLAKEFQISSGEITQPD